MPNVLPIKRKSERPRTKEAPVLGATAGGRCGSGLGGGRGSRRVRHLRQCRAREQEGNAPGDEAGSFQGGHFHNG